MSCFSWLWAKFYDKTMQDAELKCLSDWRSEILNDLSAVVVEIGCGTGVNLEYYSDTVQQLILIEPDNHMRQKLQKKIATKKFGSVTILNCSAESIPLADACCDAVVCTLVLCSVKDPSKVLAELHRILRPDGKLTFIEHVAANNNSSRLKWQHRLEPFWKIMTCGCHLTRHTEEAIVNAGFTFADISRQSMRGVPAIARPSIKGVAVKCCRIRHHNPLKVDDSKLTA